VTSTTWLFRDLEVMRFVGHGVRDRAEAKQSLDRMIDHWRRHGFGPWVLVHKRDRAFVGRCGSGFEPGASRRTGATRPWRQPIARGVRRS
jgi:RimJ/RimL family protein N-acetyltransferase